ncbi:helix-turn-helix domain-containing protein [Dongia sp.]|uniref:helix-turn-helix domain-containing protein n=1 Tax=Dongia sp. TaxID=1977262 RepID=UPI0035AEBCCC
MSGKPSYRETYGYLPEPCVRLIESGADGEELMLRVIARLGGTAIRIPVRLTSRSILVRELGDSDATRVWQIWRGKGAAGEIEVDVPRMSAAQQKARRLKLLSLLAGGVTVREAARRYGVTERTIYLMQARARDLGETSLLPKPQLDLFPAA